MNHKEIQKYREQQLKKVPNDIGVYALLDVTKTVRYIGQTVDGIRARTQRHTTSARSDIIANRLINAGEIAYIHAYVVPEKEMVTPLETHLIHHFNKQNPLMNGKIPQPLTESLYFSIPEPTVIQIMPDEVIDQKKEPGYMLLRHLQIHAELTDYIISVKDNDDLRRSLKSSLDLLVAHTQKFLET